MSDFEFLGFQGVLGGQQFRNPLVRNELELHIVSVSSQSFKGNLEQCLVQRPCLGFIQLDFPGILSVEPDGVLIRRL